MKSKTRYLIIALILLCVFIYVYLDGMNLFDIIRRYYAASKEEILARSTVYQNIDDINIFSHLKLSFQLQFSKNLQSIGSYIRRLSFFALIIPVISIFSGFVLIDRKNSLNKMVFYRLENSVSYLKHNIRSVTRESFNIAAIVYLVYIGYVVFIRLVHGDGVSMGLDSYNFLCSDFILNIFKGHYALFYIFAGFFIYFFGTFVTTFLTCSLSFMVDNKLHLLLVAILLYFGLGFLTSGFSLIDTNLSVYLNPLTLLNAFSYPITSSSLLLLVNTVPVLCGLLILKRDSKNYEIA